MRRNKNKEDNNKNILQNRESIEDGTDINSGFDDFVLYDNLTNDYQFYDEMENEIPSENTPEKAVSDELMLAETKVNEIALDNNSGELQDNRPIKLREIAVQSETTKVNAFDLFFLRIWAGLVSLIGYMANGINYAFALVFKRKLPLKYIKAFLVTLFIVLLLLLLIVPIASNSKPKSGGSDGVVIFESNMVPVQVKVNNEYKWGYLDKSKAVSGEGADSLRIPAIYEEALPFNRYGVAWGRRKEGNRNYWELINKNGVRLGKRVYEIDNPNDRPFGEFTDSKLAWVRIGSGNSGVYGYIDTKGNEKISCSYEDAGDFIDGLARVRSGTSEWYINTKGKQVGGAYDEVQDFSCGLGAVKIGGLWGYVNKKGKEVIPRTYNDVTQFVDGYAMVRRVSFFGVIDTDGDMVINTVWYYDIAIKNPIFEAFIQEHKQIVG